VTISSILGQPFASNYRSCTGIEPIGGASMYLKLLRWYFLQFELSEIVKYKQN
jgi:hypothetical protein